MKNSFTLFIISIFLFLSCSKPSIFTSIANSDYVLIDFKNLEIVDFIEEVAELTDSEIEIDGEINGKINFVSNEPILKTELITLVHAILKTKRMVLIDRGEKKYIILSFCPNKADKIAGDLDIREVMYRYIFNSTSTTGESNIKYYFLGSRQLAESNEIIDRLKDIRPKVLSRSMAKVDSLDNMLDNETLVHHVASGEDGIIYFISCIKEIEQDSVKVIWGYYFNGLGAGEDEAILKKINGEWKVMESHTLWVS